MSDDAAKRGCLYYRLDDAGAPVAEPDLKAWSISFADFDRRRIALDTRGKVRISTVFTGVDHRFFPSREPVLWETMIFGGKLDKSVSRYTSRDAALQGHQDMIAMVEEVEKTAD